MKGRFMSSFRLKASGLHDGDTDKLIVSQQVEVVRYSERDDTIYLQWPSHHGPYQQMAAIPRRIIDASASLEEMIQRCRAIGLEVTSGMEDALRMYLREATQTFIREA